MEASIINKRYCLSNDIYFITIERVNKFLELLKGKSITIIGHDNIDVDSILSGLLLSKLLNFFNIDNKFIIFDKNINNYTKKIIEELFEIDVDIFKENNEENSRNLVLVNHSYTYHRGKVLCCIDRQKKSNSVDYRFKYIKNSSSIAYIIYEMMNQVNYPFDSECIKMVIVAMMVNTMSFRSSMTAEYESIIAKELCSKYDIDYNFLEKYCLCLTKIEELSIEDIITNGLRKYKFKEKLIECSYVKLYELVDEKVMYIWINKLYERLIEKSLNMIVFLIYEIKNGITIEYQIMQDCIKEIHHNYLISRCTYVIPLIEKRIDEYYFNHPYFIAQRIIKNNITMSIIEYYTEGQVVGKFSNLRDFDKILLSSYVVFKQNKEEKQDINEARRLAELMCSSSHSKIGISVVKQCSENLINMFSKSTIYSIYNKNKIYTCKIFLNNNNDILKNKEIVTRELIIDLNGFI